MATSSKSTVYGVYGSSVIRQQLAKFFPLHNVVSHREEGRAHILSIHHSLQIYLEMQRKMGYKIEYLNYSMEGQHFLF